MAKPKPPANETPERACVRDFKGSGSTRALWVLLWDDPDHIMPEGRCYKSEFRCRQAKIRLDRRDRSRRRVDRRLIPYNARIVCKMVAAA